MSNHYLIIILGWVIGQFGYAAVSVYRLQKGKNVSYWKAWPLYLNAETGNFVMAFAGLLIILFVASDFINIEITRADLLNKQTLTLKEKIIIYQRSTSVILGAFSQHLLYIAFKKGKKKIEDYEEQNKIADN